MKTNSAAHEDTATNPSINAVIQASAGTGKTWLLTGRIIRLLLSGASPASILAITFTRKAAADMQLRLQQRLLTLSQVPDGALQATLEEIGASTTPETRSRARQLYEELLSNPYELRITTFHAFCQELLVRFPLEAGIAPKFTLAEQTAELEAAAWRALDNDLSRPSQSLERAVHCLLEECGGLANARRALQTFLDHRADWWAYTEDQSAPIDFAAQHLQRALGISPERSPMELLAADNDFRVALSDYVTGFQGKTFGKYQLSLASLTEALKPGIDAVTFYRLLNEAFLRADGLPRVFTPSKGFTQDLGVDATQKLIEQHSQLLDRLQAVIERQRTYKTFIRTRSWYVAGQRLLDHYQQTKRENDVLDFSDLEWLTYRLLNRSRHAEWVQFKLDQRIDHLLVDEFQDTNPTQWRLLLPLLQEIAAGSAERARSLFIVGDEKQSIYRFRRADAELLGLAREWLLGHTNAKVFDQYISWRSSPAIIQFVNIIFANESTTINTADFSLAGFRRHETYLQDLWGRVEIMPLTPRQTDETTAIAFRNPLQHARIAEEDLRHRREGEQIAEKIRSLIGQSIKDGPNTRAMRYGDIIILLRDRAHASAYEAALRHAHIPYIGTGRGTFLDCLEVRDIVQLLTLLITPLDDLALASVLRSPIFAVSDDDLITLADTEGKSWLERLSNHADGQSTQSALTRAAHHLPAWRQLADTVPVHDLLDRIYYETNLPERYRSAAPAHLQERVAANLTRLLELALELDSGRFPSIARFLSQLGTLTQDDNEFQGTAAADNQVRVLTIHAAKGLESPVVFLADAARAMSRDRGVRALIEWPIHEARPSSYLLVGAKNDADALTREVIARQEMAAQREEANLLYVALTRARQLLFISGCEPGARSGNRAGDATRGWYGFIERRLQTANQAVSAPYDVQIITNTPPDSADAYNVYGALAFAEAPLAKTPPTTSTVATHVAAPPALTRPFLMSSKTRVVTQPSAAALFDADGLAELNVDHATPLSLAKQRGIVIHRMLESLAVPTAKRTLIREQVWREFAGALDENWLTTCWNEACAVIDTAEHRAYFDSTQFQEAHNEVAVIFEKDGQQVTGVIDRVVVRAQDVILIDYKTNRVAEKELPTLAAHYAPQLKLYADGLRQLWPKRNITAVLLFTETRQALVVDV